RGKGAHRMSLVVTGLREQRTTTALLATFVLFIAPCARLAAQQAQSIDLSSDEVMALAYSSDGNCLAGGCMDAKVRLWDMRNNTLCRTLDGARGSVRSVAFSPDGTLVAAGGDDGVVHLWETATGKVKNALKGNSGFVGAIAFSPDGKLLASGAFD